MTTHSGSHSPLLQALATSFHSFQEAFTPCQDCWSLNTVHGETYENVVLLELGRDTATIQHQYGVDTINRADLDRESQQWLIDHSLMAEPALGSDSHLAHAA